MRIFTTNAVVVYIGSGSGSIARERAQKCRVETFAA